MQKSFKITGLILFAIYAVCLTTAFFIKGQMRTVLFNFTIIDVMSLLTSVVIGFVLAYFISVSLPKENKKNEIIEESLKAIKDDFSYLMQQFFKSRNLEINENFRSYILILTKNIDKDIFILVQLCSEKSMENYLENLLNYRRNFNYVATGDDLIVGNKLSDSFIESCSEKYYLIKQTLFQCKIELYRR